MGLIGSPARRRRCRFRSLLRFSSRKTSQSSIASRVRWRSPRSKGSMWTPPQRERLALEHQMLQGQGMSQFSVYHYPQDDSYYLFGTAQSNAGRPYDLYAPIPRGFPDQSPPLYVTKPNPLRMADGRSLSDLGVAHNMHTLSPLASGAVQICHWREPQWHAA